MHRLELRILLCLPAQVHLLEHVKRRVLSRRAHTRPPLGLQRTYDLPSALVPLEAIRFTILW